MTNSNPNSRPFSPLQKFSRAALLALPLLLLASCGEGGGDRASNGGDSFSPLPGSPEPDPPTVGQPGPGSAINSALNFGDWIKINQNPSFPGVTILPSIFSGGSSLSRVTRHLTSQEIRSLTGTARYEGWADVKRGSKTYGNLEKRRYEGSRRKSWYRDRRVKRAWNSRGPHDASRCLLRHLHPFDTIPPRHRRAPSLSQRPGRLSSNDNPTIATTPSDHYTCTNPYLC